MAITITVSKSQIDDAMLTFTKYYIKEGRSWIRKLLVDSEPEGDEYIFRLLENPDLDLPNREKLAKTYPGLVYVYLIHTDQKGLINFNVIP